MKVMMDTVRWIAVYEGHYGKWARLWSWSVYGVPGSLFLEWYPVGFSGERDHDRY